MSEEYITIGDSIIKKSIYDFYLKGIEFKREFVSNHDFREKYILPEDLKTLDSLGLENLCDTSGLKLSPENLEVIKLKNLASIVWNRIGNFD